MSLKRGILVGIAWLTVGVAPAVAATFTVDSTADAVDAAPGDGVCAANGNGCTLRAAVQEANAHAGADTINVPAGTYVLTITGAGEDSAATGDLDLTDDVTISGAGTTETIIDGNGMDRVFDIFNSASLVRISALTIRNGNPGPGAYGGGLYNSSMLTLSNVIVTGNTAAVNGGGIESDNDITLTDCTVSGNTAGASGGGIDNALTARLDNVTVSGNTSGAAGGIENIFNLTLLNVTVSGNTATSSGGGIQNDAGTAALTNVTIADNTAQSGGGFNNLSNATFGYVIVANSPSGENCAGSGTLTSQGHNLDSGNTCGFAGPGDLMNTDPQLGPLQDNGGSTFTHALSSGSPAIDAGGTDCPPPSTDQRGFTRPVDGNGDGIATCDIGAYEFASATPPACPEGATFPSIDCRLDRLIQMVQTIVPPGALHDGLGRILAKVKAQVAQAEQALANGKKRREKSMLGRARGSLGRFEARLGTRKAKHGIAADARASMKSAADQLRQDLMTLRRSS
jgi:CSLREA domain-containing protein